MFGIELIDASLLPAMLVALVAGLLSFLSPCVLPIVPPYLAYMSGVSMNDLSSGAGSVPKAMPCDVKRDAWCVLHRLLSPFDL